MPLNNIQYFRIKSYRLDCPCGLDECPHKNNVYMEVVAANIPLIDLIESVTMINGFRASFCLN